MITDPESDADQVMEFVGGLMLRLEGLHKKAFTYKSYQKSFKVYTCVYRDTSYSLYTHSLLCIHTKRYKRIHSSRRPSSYYAEFPLCITHPLSSLTPSSSTHIPSHIHHTHTGVLCIYMCMFLYM